MSQPLQLSRGLCLSVLLLLQSADARVLAATSKAEPDPVTVADAGDGVVRHSRWILLANGDRFTGEFTSEVLPVLTSSGEVLVKTATISGLALINARSSEAVVFLRDGKTLEGRLSATKLTFSLKIGGQITVSPQIIVKISDVGAPGAAFAGRKGDSLQPAPDVISGGTTLANMVWIPAGLFLMGSPAEEPGRDPDEGPQTRVIITQGFWIGRFEVTQGEFQEVMGSNPSHATGDPKRPVEKVTWHEAVEYCQRLTQAEDSRGRLPKGYAYRLPSEAEWENACRASATSRFSYGDDRNETQLAEYAWFARNSESMTHPVGTRRPNPWGLHDMHGNVWEWCLDRWEGKFPGGSVTNSPVPAVGNLRVARGGSWLYEAKACRSANRDDYGPGNRCSDLGFRVVLAPVGP